MTTWLRQPREGDVWRSRDPRDDGLTVNVLRVENDRVYIQRFNRTSVALRRWHFDYEYHEDDQ